MAEQVANESLALTVIRVLSVSSLRRIGTKCVKSIFYNFFFLQYKAAILPGRIPVSQVDHPLDRKIPFSPRWIAVYLDFVAFWVRSASFLLRSFGRRAYKPVEGFVASITELYRFAAEVYTRNLSTTARPRYFARPRFILIHAADPHLMCIPSLHIMIVIWTYTKFRNILRVLGQEEGHAAQIEELIRDAGAIAEAVLYVKQHSVNCVAAAMYAMTCFDRALFPPEEAERFVSRLFNKTEFAFAGLSGTELPVPGDGKLIRAYIWELYRRFLAEGESAQSWEEPLIRFLRELPLKT